MINTVSTLILLLLGQSASSFHVDLLKFSQDSNEIFFTLEETEEISAVSDVKFLADLQKDIQKILIISGSDFSLFFAQAWPIIKMPGEVQEIIPNLSTAKIIYPFHSFL